MAAEKMVLCKPCQAFAWLCVRHNRVYFLNANRKDFEMCPYIAQHIWYIMLKYVCALDLTTGAHTFPSILIKLLILILQFIFIFQFVTYSPLSYDNYKYPDWGQVIGWLLTLSSLSLIPAVMIFKLIKTTGTMKEVNISRSGFYFKY